MDARLRSDVGATLLSLLVNPAALPAPDALRDRLHSYGGTTVPTMPQLAFDLAAGPVPHRNCSSAGIDGAIVVVVVVVVVRTC